MNMCNMQYLELRKYSKEGYTVNLNKYESSDTPTQYSISNTCLYYWSMYMFSHAYICKHICQ